MTPTDNTVYPGIPEEWLSEEDYELPPDVEIVSNEESAELKQPLSVPERAVEMLDTLTPSEWHLIITLIARYAHMMRFDLRSGRLSATAAMRTQVQLDEYDAILAKLRAAAEFMYGSGTCEREMSVEWEHVRAALSRVSG